MNKATSAAVDVSKFCKSSFTLTFAIEILGIDVWHDCNEGWVDLGPCLQGLKLQYQLYPGQQFDVDILIWPHVAKIWCGTQYGFVRTWQFLERRWLAFSIRHAFPVRVVDLRNYVSTVTPTNGIAAFGSNAKNDKVFEVFLPPLNFGQRRYFAPVLESENSTVKFILDLIWGCVASHIPASFLDGVFDVPYPVSDVRHQDSVLYNVKEIILNHTPPEEEEETEKDKQHDLRHDPKTAKDKEKKKLPEPQKIKFEFKLSGDTILAGAGTIAPFESYGDRPPDLGEVIVLISSQNLPASDDLPILFVNVNKLFSVPVETLEKLRISQIYTRWNIGEEQHSSLPQTLKRTKCDYDMNDHHAMPLPLLKASEIAANFQDSPFEIELRGIKLPPLIKPGKLFGIERNDIDYDKLLPPLNFNDDLDIIIAYTKIDAHSLAKANNRLVKGDFPLFPPRVAIDFTERIPCCTNEINAIGATVKPEIYVQPYIILEAQMNLEVSVGFVGCKPPKASTGYSRLYCLEDSTEALLIHILKAITGINEDIVTQNKSDLLTGFAIDTGDCMFYYVEGPCDAHILKVWELMTEYYPRTRPLFTASVIYANRLYSDLITVDVPFIIMKMYSPIGMLLACPPIYARPTLPLPARIALLKLNSIILDKLRVLPNSKQMPTINELRSFRIELCVPRRNVVLKVTNSQRDGADVEELDASITRRQVSWFK